MSRAISKTAREELVESLRLRYRKASKKEKTRILHEFVAVSGYHRKHAVRLLGMTSKQRPVTAAACSRRIYNQAVREALIVVWEAADRICGKRLKAILPDFVDAMERNGYLELHPSVRKQLLAASPATIDRLLAPIRAQARPRRRRRSRRSKVKAQVPVRTFSDWEAPRPGFLEIDFVEHGGGSVAGAYVHTLAVTDVCSGWTESLPLLAREQSLVVEALQVLRRQLTFPLLGIDTDNDSAFINSTLAQYCEDQQIEFTRSRAYRKNDQAWIEQKNGAVIRRFVGYDRFSGVVAAQTLARLYQGTRLYVNFFQPSFKLKSKSRNGAKVRRTYHSPATPCDRILARKDIEISIRQKLRRQRQRLDPVVLLHQIRETQSALAALARKDDAPRKSGLASLEQFLAELPDLWRAGEVRPTHQGKAAGLRTWRTRKDPFETEWPIVLGWLQDEPDATAKDLFDRLQAEYPGRFEPGQLRTLQRRIREWRHIMARQLVYAGIEENECAVDVPFVTQSAGK